MATLQPADVASIHWAPTADDVRFKGRAPDLTLAGQGFWIDSPVAGTPNDANDPIFAQTTVKAALFSAPVASTTAAKGPTVMVDLRVKDPGGRAVKDAEVTFVSATPNGGDSVRTDSFGRALLCITPAHRVSQNHLVVEAAGFWGLRLESPLLQPGTMSVGGHNTLVLQPMTRTAIDSPCWGYEAMRLDAAPQGTALGARPVRVAVIACHPWGGRSPKPLLSEIVSKAADSDLIMGWGPPSLHAADHTVLEPVSSTIAGLVQICAPGVEMHRILLPMRASISDLIAALDLCLRSKIDVACLATVCARPNKALQHALQLARAEGLIMVAPAGDTPGDVGFPACAPEVLGVAAVGCVSGQPGSEPHSRLLGAPCHDGIAPFACGATGPGIDVAAPGIAVMVNNEQVSGTVVAAGNVTGFVARLLQSSFDHVSRPRSALRATAIETLLRSSCVDLGLPSTVQGAGLPVWGQKGRARMSGQKEVQMAEHAQQVLARLARLQA